MSSGQWEVVGKKKDKNNPAKKGTKNEKKVVNGPKVEEVLPKSELKALFAATDKTNKENRKPQEKDVKPKEQKKQQSPKRSEKKPSNPPKPKIKSLESGLNQIKVDELKSLLEVSKQRFPDAPLVWLKELAMVLNNNLPVELSDPVFTNKPETYPLSVTPAGIRQVMEKAVQGCTPAVTNLFYEISLTAMATDMSKGLPAIGHKLWLQFLAHRNPQTVSLNIEKHVMLRNSYQNRQPIGLSILWGLGQGGVKNFNVGFSVFKDVMLHLLEMKNYSRFVVQYLSNLLTWHKTHPIPQETYVFLLDFINSKHNLPNDLSQELLKLNVKLHEILLAKHSTIKKSAVIEPLFEILQSSSNAALRNKTFEALLEILVQDPGSYSTLKQLYPKYLQQSVGFLKYISDNWKKTSTKAKNKHFTDFIKDITIINNELSSKKKKDASLSDAVAVCKVLSDRMTTKRTFPWRGTSFLLITAIGALLAYDINKHGSWQKTRTVHTLKETGTWELAERAWNRTLEGVEWSKQRIDEYAPGYRASAAETLAPYVELSKDLGLIIFNTGNRVRLIVAEKIPVVVETVEVYAPGLTQHCQTAWKTLQATSVQTFNNVYDFTATKVFVHLTSENIKNVSLDVWNTTQHYTVEYYNWLCKKVQNSLK